MSAIPPADPAWLRILPVRLRVRLAGRTSAFAVIHNSGWLLFDSLIRLILGLLVGAWVARYLGPAQFGHLAYVLAYIALFQAVANLGADGIIVRDIARDRTAAHQVLGTAFALRLTVGIVCWLAAVGGMALMNGLNDPSVALTAVAAGSLVFHAADTIDLWFQSQSQSRRTVIAKLIAYSLSSGVKVALILAKAPLVAFAAAMLVDVVAASIALAVAYRRYPTDGRWRILRTRAVELLRESWPFMLSGVSIMVYMRIDQIMLKELVGKTELGIYAAALPLSQVWNIIPITLAISLAPIIAKRKAQGQREYYDALLFVFRLFGLIAIFVSVITALASPMIVSFLYGQAYTPASTVLAIHVFSNLFVFQGVAQSLWLVNERAGHLALIKAAIGGVVAIASNALLIPMLGAKGAAISAVLSFAASAVLSNYYLAPQILLMQFGFRPPRIQ